MSYETDEIGLDLSNLTLYHWLGILLAAVTGAIHLYLYTLEGFLPFLAGGLGYFGAIVLLVFNVKRRLLYLGGIAYTLIHIVGWAVAGMPDGGWELAGAAFVNLGTVDKLVELALIGVLVYLYRETTASPAYQTTGERAS